MEPIIAADGREVALECIGCAISKKEVAPPGGMIAETDYFTLANDFEYPIKGFLIIGSKRHFQSVADFTPEESANFSSFLIKTRKAMRDVLGIQQVTIIQEEKSKESHFHIWVFPWHEWIKEIGSDIVSIRAIMQYAKEHYSTKEAMDEIASDSQKLREYFSR
jgi:diadenosine tetraphosphate (Ap4A) HIT family hydrolase